MCVCVYFSISNKYTKYFYYYESNDSVMTISMVKPILFWNFWCSHWIYRIGALILTGRLCTSLGNVSSHFLQLNGFSLVWILSCSLRLLPSLASVHGVWFVSEWFSIFWLFSFNVCLQFEQVNGFSLEESLSWSFKAVLSNFWSHLAQLNQAFFGRFYGG